MLWDVARQYALGELLTGHSDSVRGLAFSPDGQLLASASTDLTVRLWDIATGQPLGSPLSGQSGFVNDVAFSPDGQLLASAHNDQTAILWEVATGQQIGPPITIPQGPVAGVTFSPDGKLLAVALEDLFPILLWDVTTQQRVESATVMTSKKPAFSPDGQLLAGWRGREGHGVMLWDANTHQALGPPLLGHTEGIINLTFSPDGTVLASGGHDTTIILWDVVSHQPIRQPLTGHPDRVNDLAFNADGRILASGGEAGQVILWDMTSHQPLGRLLENGDRIWSVVFSSNPEPEQQYLAWGGRNDGTIVLWRANPNVWRAEACQRVGRNLTRTEWERYLGNEPYRLTCPNHPAPMNKALPPPAQQSLAPRIFDFSQQPAGQIIETFDSDQGFIQTHENVTIVDGQVQWHFERSGGEQYVYRNIPRFSGNLRLTVQGQVDSWTNNCAVQVGVGERLGAGASVHFGWTGGGCDTQGPLVFGRGVQLDQYEKVACEYTGNWLWIEKQTPYTATLTIIDSAATLAVESVGQATGEVLYEGAYTSLWVGETGRGDWPECTGTVETVIVEPLD